MLLPKEISLGKVIFLLLAAIFGSIPTSAAASFASTSPAKPPCRINIENAHISKYVFRKHGIRVVIIKANSVCDKPQSQVILTVQIYKTGFFGDLLVSESHTNPEAPSSSGFIVFNKGTTKTCLNSTETHYYGIAFSKALINGRWLYAGRTYSPKTVILKCGT